MINAEHGSANRAEFRAMLMSGFSTLTMDNIHKKQAIGWKPNTVSPLYQVTTAVSPL